MYSEIYEFAQTTQVRQRSFLRDKLRWDLSSEESHQWMSKKSDEHNELDRFPPLVNYNSPRFPKVYSWDRQTVTSASWVPAPTHNSPRTPPGRGPRRLSSMKKLNLFSRSESCSRPRGLHPHIRNLMDGAAGTLWRSRHPSSRPLNLQIYLLEWTSDVRTRSRPPSNSLKISNEDLCLALDSVNDRAWSSSRLFQRRILSTLLFPWQTSTSKFNIVSVLYTLWDNRLSQVQAYYHFPPLGGLNICEIVV